MIMTVGSVEDWLKSFNLITSSVSLLNEKYGSRLDSIIHAKDTMHTCNLIHMHKIYIYSQKQIHVHKKRI